VGRWVFGLGAGLVASRWFGCGIGCRMECLCGAGRMLCGRVG
jgi:hypothetical protein